MMTAALGLERRPQAASRALPSHAPYRVAPAFVRNPGRVDPAALFVAVGGGRPIYFTSRDVRIVDPVHQRSVWLTLVGAHASRIEGDAPTGGAVTYLSKSGARREPAFRDIVYRGAWPGVDARFSSGDAGLEYAFEVAAGVDPSAIRLQYRGAERGSLNARGELVLDAGGETIVDRAPIAYQRVGGTSAPVPVRFVQHGSEIGFALGDYDRTRPLVIDPTLAYTTYLGGSGDDIGRGIAVDAAGGVYVTGVTGSSDFPVTPGALQTAFGGGTAGAPRDAFVAKIDAAGKRFAYVTYLGGSGSDEAFGVAVDAGGSAYVTGFTESSDFPTTAGAFRTTIAIGGHDGFVAKLNATGSALLYSTYFGASGTQGSSIAVDAGGSAYVAGFTVSNTLPVTSGAIMPPKTSSARPISDAYLLKFSADGSSVAYGTYIAGSDQDVPTGVAVDGAGHAVVAGWTKSLDLPTSSAAVQPIPNSATYKSSDAGQAFAADNNGIRATEVDAIAIDPQQTSNVYEASVDAGLLKSADGGATWSRLLPAPASAVVVNPIAPTTIFAIAANGAGSPFLARSTDGGATWTVVLAGAGRVAVAASNPTTLFVIRAGGDVVKSTDDGATWTTVLASAGALSLAVDPTNASIAYVGLPASQVKKTADGGATWTASIVPSFAPSNVDNLAVDPTQPSVVWASVQNRLFRSTVGGASWSSTYFGSGGGAIAFDGGTMYTSGGVYGVLQKTSDRGATWTTLTLRGSTVLALSVAANGGVVFVGIKAHIDSFAYKIDTTATSGAAALLYGTYVGGTLDDQAAGIALDPSGNAVIALQTSSVDLPLTMSTPHRVMALARLAPDGASYRAFTWAGGGSTYSAVSAVVADRAGFAYMAGIDADGYYYWVAQVDPTGTTTSQWSLYDEAVDAGQPLGAAIDASSSVYLTGAAFGALKTTSGAAQGAFGGGAEDAFATKIAFGDATTDLARGRPAVASSIEVPQYAAANAVDGDLTTRWSSQWSDPQWIYVDLGQRVQIDHVVLRWETAYGRQYAIQVSDDAQTWTDPPHVFSGGGTDVVTLSQGGVVGRYVRMYGFQRGTQWGYSLWSFEVYGTPVSSPPPPSPLPSPWKSADVGAVGVPGSASFANGTFDVSGAGADIWGTSDAFQFVYQPTSADVDFVTTVGSLENTHQFAKAGLMFRESLDPGSRHVIVDMRPDGNIEFMTRDATGGVTTFLAGASHAFPATLRLSKSGHLITAFVGEGSAWLEIGHVSTTIGSSLNAGLIVTSLDTSRTALATFNATQVTPAFESWPSPWTDDDVGAVGLAGSASYSSAFTVNGSGADIWGTADAFNYVSQPVSGDFSIVAHVAGVQNTNPYAKAGVDMRDAKTGSSAHVILDVRPDGSIEFMQRAADGASTTFLAGASHVLPLYLMLVREGNTVTGAVSSDGITFTQVGHTTVATAATTFAGMAVTSHDNSLINTSTFDSAYLVNYAIHTRPQPPSNIVVYANDIAAGSLHGSWTRTSDATATAGVKLATPDNGASQTGNALANPPDYVDVTFNANAGTPYTIWLRLQAAANSKYNDSVWVQFSNATVNGSTAYQIGSMDGLLVNLATDTTGSSVNGWGWQNTAYWLSQATTVMFPTDGAQTLRIQVREDGVQFDQIVLSPSQYLKGAPGPLSNDATIVPK